MTGVDEGTYVPDSSETLNAYLHRWLEHMKGQVRPNTHARYSSLLRLHVVPRLGQVPLRDLRASHVQTVLSAMKDHSPRTELHAYRVLSNALTDAVEWGVLTVNPARGVKPRRVRGRSRALDVPDVATVARLVEAAEGSVYHIAFMLAAFTGLRRGEIVSLRWRDVDLEQGTLRVMRTAVLDGPEITRLLETGVHIKVVSEMAGHATSFTMDQYGHKMPSFRGHAGSAMEQVYGG